jgi:hypothetical protein
MFDKLINLEIDWVLWIAGFFALLEFGKWAWSLIEYYLAKVHIETKRMRREREIRDKLIKAEKDIAEIRETSIENVNTFLEHEKLMSENFVSVKEEIVQELGKLHDKIDDQRKHLEDIDTDGKRRDCSLMRDRLIQGLRYFSQQRDEDGVVHISMTDYENLNEMFGEYFNCNGNGVCHSLYENEFKKFKIDTDRKY